MMRERVYSILIKLYPPSFRKRYGREIIETISDLRGASALTGFRFWLFLCVDACRAAIEQYVDLWKRSSRQALKWIAACTVGAVAWKAIGTAFGWAVAYLYHPYLEGIVLSPWLYGATLGAGLGAAQCVVLRQLPRTTWILMSAAFAAVALELAVLADAFVSPWGFGIIVGAVVAGGQWVVLGDCARRPSRVGAVGASLLSMAAIALGVALNRAPSTVTALNHYVVHAAPRPMSMVQQLYAPANWTEWTIGLIAIATAGLVVGAITARPVSSMLSDAR